MWSLYAALYVYALKQAQSLELTEAEIVLTQRVAGLRILIYVGVCALVHPAGRSPRQQCWLPGLIYFLLGPCRA